MQIVHFEVDSELGKYLKGDKFEKSLNQFENYTEFENVECISIKIDSSADEKTLSNLPQLKLLITRTVGTDHIDINYCNKKGITVKNIPDYGAFNIAEHAFAMLLTGCRNIREIDKEIKNGKYSNTCHLGYALKGKVLGVIGTGRIGLEMIKRAKGFEMEVSAFDIHKKEEFAKALGFEYISLDKLLESSDIISLHAPLTPETHHMIAEPQITKMKEGVILINTARGGLIDTQSLINNISKFRFLGLDVLEDENKFDKENPFLKYDKVLITPHVAYYSDLSVKKIAQETEKIIEEFLLEKQ
jgi:D-lactate dehydrogenase